VIGRALLVIGGLALAAPSSARADGCPASSVDVGSWALVRSSRVPGFSLRLPRSFTRDSTTAATDSMPTARWTDAARGRFTMSHRTTTSASASLPVSEGLPSYARCEDRVGAATATIVAYGDGKSAYVVHARIRWPDGEALDIHASATDRAQLDQVLAAVRTIRRVGA
jgi:hypothetical protein